jgi:hypothetical protein
VGEDEAHVAGSKQGGNMRRKRPTGVGHDKTIAVPPVFIEDSQTGLPVIQCKHAAKPQEEITPERAANILLSQEAEWHLAAGSKTNRGKRRE